MTHLKSAQFIPLLNDQTDRSNRVDALTYVHLYLFNLKELSQSSTNRNFSHASSFFAGLVRQQVIANEGANIVEPIGSAFYRCRLEDRATWGSWFSKASLFIQCTISPLWCHTPPRVAVFIDSDVSFSQSSYEKVFGLFMRCRITAEAPRRAIASGSCLVDCVFKGSTDDWAHTSILEGTTGPAKFPARSRLESRLEVPHPIFSQIPDWACWAISGFEYGVPTHCGPFNQIDESVLSFLRRAAHRKSASAPVPPQWRGTLDLPTGGFAAWYFDRIICCCQGPDGWTIFSGSVLPLQHSRELGLLDTEILLKLSV